ncbi:aldolase [Aureimonas sp. ME7]|uniref:3-oxo-tetronate 4-phosphate decarboxylase n=1 Tax=Aureimonas sp. ME7 TaxID=2744252 RepID=UPI0015F54DD2|nr:aldolase [Aureimonas sp. ME7]
MSERELREEMVRYCRSLFERGFSVGTAGNVSARVADGFLMTPTNSCLGFLEPERISKLDKDWNHVGGDKPSKEVFLHRAFYETRPATGAVVHLHCTHCTALSCLADLDDADCVEPITPYVVMRVGKVARVPYVKPGDPRSGDLIRGLDGRHAAVLLANHGPVVAGKDLTSAVYASEELEETAKLLLMLRPFKTQRLTDTQVEELEAGYARQMR